MKKSTIKGMISLLCSVAIVFGIFASIPVVRIEAEASTSYLTKTAYKGAYSDTNGTYAGTDDLGRVLTKDNETHATKSNKYVGVFYFLWQGEHGTAGPYNNTEIVKNNPSAINSETAWVNAGGGGAGAHHFWGEPLFGYYKSQDTWVMRKQLQMFMDADVDFICIDATNGYSYSSNVKKLIDVWHTYLKMGCDVPKIMFYTNTNSGATMTSIYNNIYNNADLKAKYSRLSELWFNWEGKPLIVGKKSEASTTINNYFRVKASQWPNSSKTNDGFPWMEFDRLNTSSAVYTYNGLSMMNVSVAQHNATCRFSATAWYNGKDRSRSYVNGANNSYSKAYLYGHNFAEQWEFAINKDPDLVFITGWNEWVAQRQNKSTTGYNISGEPIWFVDCADVNTSRDIEPMRGYFGDNYYMQFIDYVRKYKGTAPRVNTGKDVTIDITGDMSQWDSSAITAKYTDYKKDIVDRNCAGFGSLTYTDTTGRNDIVSTKVTKDADNIYFYAKTASTLTSYTDDNWMTLFIKNNDSTANNWYGYQYAVNYKTPASETEAYLSKSKGSSGKWSTVQKVSMKIDGKEIMISIPRSAIGMTDDLFDIEFKWADNYVAKDFWSFYENGDSAPYGRLNYVFSNCVITYNGNISYSSGSYTYKMGSVNTDAKNIKISGWALNNLHPSSNVEIHAYVGGTAGTAGAVGYNLGKTNVLNNEVNRALEISGKHEFNFSFTHPVTGTHTLAIYAVLEDTHKLIYQGKVTLKNETTPPVGCVDYIKSPSINTINIIGWAYDPDARSTSISVQAEVNGVTYDLGITDSLRSDVNSAESVSGNHGFNKTITTDIVGDQTVKVYAVDSGGNIKSLIKTGTVNVMGKCDYYTDANTLYKTKNYKYGATLTSAGTLTKFGYTFAGWKYSHGGTTMPNKNITATPIWEKITVDLMGDVDNSGIVNIKDATCIQKYSAGLLKLSDKQLVAADVDKSSTITVSDATSIQKYTINLISSLE